MRQAAFSSGNTARLTGANPLSKLFAASAITFALAVSIDWVSASVALVLELLVIPLVGISLAGLLARAWPLLLAAIFAAWGTALVAVDSGPVVLDLGYLDITEGSLATGIAIMARGMAIAIPGILLMVSTDPTDLADALAQKARLPHRFVLGTLAALRLVGLMVEEWRTLGLARRARGVGSGRSLAGRAKANLGQGFGLLVQAIRRGSRLAVTMEARGFGAGPRSWARTSTFNAIDAWVCLGGAAIAGVAVGAAISAGTWNVILF